MRNTRNFHTPEKTQKLIESAKIFDHMNPTFASTLKRKDLIFNYITEGKTLLSCSKSVERPIIKRKVKSREIKHSNPKKLVYPSVRRLKTWMSQSVTEEIQKPKQLRKILFDHINKNMRYMNLRVSKEIEQPSVSNCSTQVYHMKLPEIEKLDSEFKRIQINHKKAGIMRRNKLLLEHIMHERIRTKQIFRPGLQNFKTNVSVSG